MAVFNNGTKVEKTYLSNKIDPTKTQNPAKDMYDDKNQIQKHRGPPYLRIRGIAAFT